MAENHDHEGESVEDKVRRLYGFVAWALDHAELGPILRQAAEEEWDESRLQGAIQRTTWWQTTNAAQRTFDEQKATNPGEVARRIEQRTAEIVNKVKLEGWSIPVQRAREIAETSLRMGWSESELTASYKAEFRYNQFTDPSNDRLAYLGPNGEPGWAPWDTSRPPTAVQNVMPDGRIAFYVPSREGEQVERRTGELRNGLFVDTSSNKAAFLGPNGEPGYGSEAEARAARPQGNPQRHRMPDNREVWYFPGGTGFVDTATGRAAYLGPNGEPGYRTREEAQAANPNAAVQAFTMPDGREAFYVTRTPGQGEMQVGQFGPAIHSLADRLRERAEREYLVPLSEETLGVWVEKVVRGEAQEADFDTYLKGMARTLFPSPAIEQALDKGMTIRQFISPYQELAARTLEVTPESIDFMDPKWFQFLVQTDAKGNRTTAGIYEMLTTIRSDPLFEWHNTAQANELAAQKVLDLETRMGVRRG